MGRTVLVGNNLAVLVAAAELGAAGEDVVLLDDGKPSGGHFRGMRVGDHDFDLGMVLLEKAASSDVDTGRHDWARSGPRVGDWLEAQVELRRTPTPEVLVASRRWPDHMIANRVDVFGGDQAPAGLARDDPRHAANKAHSPAFDTLSYAEAATLNHGRALHQRSIAPFLDKLGVDAGELLARHHRAAWVPLYWPDTLAEACAGRPVALPEYAFFATSSGFTGQLVRALERRIAELPGVQVHASPVSALTPTSGGLQLRTEDGGDWSGERTVLGLAPPRVHALLGTSPAATGPAVSVVLGFCLVRATAMTTPVGCLTVVDEDVATYRITDQDALAGLDPEWHRVVVEATPSSMSRVAAGAGAAGDELLLKELRDLLGVAAPSDVQLLRSVTAGGAVAVPTAAAVDAAASAAAGLAASLPGTTLTGALLGFGMASMNEQVLQGLTIAEERR